MADDEIPPPKRTRTVEVDLGRVVQIHGRLAAMLDDDIALLPKGVLRVKERIAQAIAIRMLWIGELKVLGDDVATVEACAAKLTEK